jgi:hypothetical protein
MTLAEDSEISDCGLADRCVGVEVSAEVLDLELELVLGSLGSTL